MIGMAQIRCLPLLTEVKFNQFYLPELQERAMVREISS
jgi:hypothetical protein